MVLPAHVADTPAGNPFAPSTLAFEIPVAPVVAIAIFGAIAVLIHKAGDEEGVPAVLFAATLIVPVAFTVPQPPVSGML